MILVGLVLRGRLSLRCPGRRLRDGDLQRKTQLHDIVDQNFDVIGSGRLKWNLAKNGNIRGIERGVFQRKSHFALSKDGGLVWRNQPNVLNELADSGGPAREKTKFSGGDRKLRDANEIDDADDDEIAIGFLANVFADQSALEVGENSCWLHINSKGKITNGKPAQRRGRCSAKASRWSLARRRRGWA